MNLLSVKPSSRKAPQEFMISAAIILFVIAVTLTDISSLMIMIVRISGFILVFHRLLAVRRVPIPPEVILYGLFVFWSIVSGFLVARDRAGLLNIVLLIGQIALSAYAIAGIVGIRMDPYQPFLALIIGALILSFYGAATGLFSQGFDPFSRFRFSAFMRNPNTLAHNLFMATVGLALFWGKAKVSTRLVLGILIALFSIVIVFSGSRKAFLGLLLFCGLWVWFCYRPDILRHPLKFLILLGLLVGAFFAVDYIYTSTYLGYRLMLSQESAFFIGTKRAILYNEGWQYFLENPLSGIGLGNFQSYSSLQAYSHSDYMEVLATTGLPGFILYFVIYLVLLARLFRLRRFTSDEFIQYRLGVFIAFVLTLVVLAAGRINSQSILTMFTLATTIGYSFQYEQMLQVEKKFFHKMPAQKMTSLKPSSRNE